MVPAALVRLPGLPLTPNGKLDRNALPLPTAAAYEQAEYVAPVNATEASLAEIWSGLLGVERIGRHDNFFNLGGHSLLATRLVAAVQSKFNRKITLQMVFDSPTPEALGQRLLATYSVPAGAGKIERVSRDGALVMSFGQQRLWFLTGMEGVSEAYHVMAGFRLSGPLNEEALRRALLRLVARHEALRTRFVTLDGEAVQWIDGPETPVAYTVDDLGAKSATALEALMAAESATPFDLERGPLFRARRVRLAAQEHVLLLTMHHIVSDGWSLGVMRRELGALYTAFASGDEDRLTPLTVQYADYAAWQRRWLSGSALAEQAQYWRTALAGAPTLIELPTDRQRPSRQDFAGASVPVTLDRTTTAGLKRLAQRQGLTLYMVVLAGWALVLSKLSGQDDIVIGSPSANRGPLETEGLIGFFVNMLAMRIDLSDAPSVTELLSRVRRTTLAAQAHQDLPFEQVVEVVRPVRNMAHSPIFQVALAWQNTEPDPLVMPDLVVEPLAERRDSAKFDLLLDLTEQDGMVVGALEYATALFDSDTAARFAHYLETALRAIAVNPDQAAAAVPLLSGDDRPNFARKSSEEVRDDYGNRCPIGVVGNVRSIDEPAAGGSAEGVADYPVVRGRYRTDGCIERIDAKAARADEAAEIVFEAPVSATEEVISRLWKEILGVEHIGRHDNFFDLGGHSLLGARLVTRMKAALEIDIRLATLFARPTVAAVAEHVDLCRLLARGPEPVCGETHTEEGML
jgi:acyl carrier protein